MLGKPDGPHRRRAPSRNRVYYALRVRTSTRIAGQPRSLQIGWHCLQGLDENSRTSPRRRSDTMASRNQVLPISLHNQPWFDEMYDALLAAVRSKADIERAQDATSALRLLSQQPPPSAVLVTDEALTLAENTHVWDAALEYVRQGGTAVVMGLFPSFVLVDEMKPFFSRAGLDWEVASYQRTTTVLDRAAVGTALAAKLPPSYRHKAVSVKNFAPAEAWYQPHEDEGVTGESTVLLARVGSGKLGHVGDVNAEKGSDAAILAMCGLC